MPVFTRDEELFTYDAFNGSNFHHPHLIFSEHLCVTGPCDFGHVCDNSLQRCVFLCALSISKKVNFINRCKESQSSPVEESSTQPNITNIFRVIQPHKALER